MTFVEAVPGPGVATKVTVAADVTVHLQVLQADPLDLHIKLIDDIVARWFRFHLQLHEDLAKDTCIVIDRRYASSLIGTYSTDSRQVSSAGECGSIP
ncbi:hypothetical protein HOLleu_19284 [Holothuria leucospilota]|uniref:Uncharacterized protein n=1 Tax=Holothuria leucospilota TaxID=206669 RepID=A0A9Q1BZ48_HOLLE|nr:hypothetical protein HOLleu_19284 [Holothuria leucospilota]